MSSSTLRLSGLNSGYDTEAMIEQLMTTYQTKIDTQEKKLTKLSWQQDAYRDIISKLTDFSDKYFDILNKSTYIMTPSAFSKFSSSITTKSSGSNATGLNVTTTSSSSEGTYKLNVSQLATAATASGSTLSPQNFSLDLEKASAASYYTTETADDGTVTRNYSFSLDVQVGSVTKTVSFDVSAEETDGEIDQDAFNESVLSALNSELQTSFGLSGRSGSSATGVLDDDGNEWYIQAELDGNTLSFAVGGNVNASVTEKVGVFGMSEASTSISIATQSAVTGENTIAVEVGGVIKSVSFEGVSSTYYDSKDDEGNEEILAEYNALKLAAYKSDNNLSASATVSQDDLDNYTYTTTQAAKDKNSAAIEEALNTAFEDEGVTFTIDGSYITASKGGEAQEFSITATSGGTLGLTKGTANNKYSTSTTLEEMGIESNTDDGGYTFTINGTEITVAEGATISSLLSAVNGSDAGVTMTYSSLTNSFEIVSNDMGTSGSITIEGNAITNALGLTDDDGNMVSYTTGQNAIFELNGQTIYQNSNTYTTDGTTFEFTEDMEIGETYTVSLTKDYEDIKQTIKDFIEDYNQLIEDVYDYIGTSPKRDSDNNTYEPLTDAEKEEMSDEEIEKWENYAKIGVIYNDSTVTSIMSKIRTALYSSVTLDDGSTFGLYNMGITTSSDYTDHGKLELDEDAFEAAFSENADAICKLFTDSESGIMKKVDSVIDGAISTSTSNRGTLITKAGLESGSTSTDNYIYKQMLQVQERISTLQDRYDAKEEYWWNVFTNLETMMSELNSQSSYLSSYLGS